MGVEQSRAFAAAAAAAGDRPTSIELEGEGHYAFLDPRQPAFEVLFAALDRWRTAAPDLRRGAAELLEDRAATAKAWLAAGTPA